MNGRSQSPAPISEGDPLPPDNRLTEGMLGGEIDALYRSRAKRLIGAVMPSVADREIARDVVHEAFAKFAALSSARRLMIIRPEAYLYRICLNIVRDRARVVRDLGPANDAEAHFCPIAELEHRDTLRRLEAAMLRLKPKTREIFLAKRLDGMTYAEIAARTGLSVKGVEKHMSKAIAVVDRAVNRL